MIEEIKKHKPQCSTHWYDGRYYIKTIRAEWLVYFEGGWFPFVIPDTYSMISLVD